MRKGFKRSASIQRFSGFVISPLCLRCQLCQMIFLEKTMTLSYRMRAAGRNIPKHASIGGIMGNLLKVYWRFSFVLPFSSPWSWLFFTVHATGNWGEYTLHVVKDCIHNLCPHTIGISKVQWSEKSTVPLRMEQGLVLGSAQFNLLCSAKWQAVWKSVEKLRRWWMRSQIKGIFCKQKIPRISTAWKFTDALPRHSHCSDTSIGSCPCCWHCDHQYHFIIFIITMTFTSSFVLGTIESIVIDHWQLHLHGWRLRSGFCKLACISLERIYDLFAMTPSLDIFESHQLADTWTELWRDLMMLTTTWKFSNCVTDVRHLRSQKYLILCCILQPFQMFRWKLLNSSLHLFVWYWYGLTLQLAKLCAVDVQHSFVPVYMFTSSL